VRVLLDKSHPISPEKEENLGSPQTQQFSIVATHGPWSRNWLMGWRKIDGSQPVGPEKKKEKKRMRRLQPIGPQRNLMGATPHAQMKKTLQHAATHCNTFFTEEVYQFIEP